MVDDFTDVQQSYGRCLRTGDFISRFYEIVMDSHPDIRAAFATTDFGKQRRALRRGITSALLYGAGSDLVTRAVEQVAELHSRGGRATVRPELYQYWLDSLVSAVREADPNCTKALESRWRSALKPAIDQFTAKY